MATWSMNALRSESFMLFHHSSGAGRGMAGASRLASLGAVVVPSTTSYPPKPPADFTGEALPEWKRVTARLLRPRQIEAWTLPDTTSKQSALGPSNTGESRQDPGVVQRAASKRP